MSEITERQNPLFDESGGIKIIGVFQPNVGINNTCYPRNKKKNAQKNEKLILSCRSQKNLVRLAHPPKAGNDGMMEYWNNGFDSLHHIEKYDDSWDKWRHGFEKQII